MKDARRRAPAIGADWLRALEHGLHRHWQLGRNMILSWCASGDGIEVLAVRHYRAVTFAATHSTLSGEEAALVGDASLAGTIHDCLSGAT